MKRSLNAKAPTPQQFEKIRLLLSTYQDGTGQHATKNGTLPNWRDFERSVATAMSGRGTENKSLFDVVVRLKGADAYGISCKMKDELTKAYTQQILHFEITNSSRLLWDALRAIGINNAADMIARPAEAGYTILNLVESWGEFSESLEGISLQESYYLLLLWKPKTEDFQLFQLPLSLPDPSELEWHARPSGCLVGCRDGRNLIEWYGLSGGQMKYYPHRSEAVWQSDLFRLEPLPFTEDGYGIEQKARTFFPEQWAKTDEYEGEDDF